MATGGNANCGSEVRSRRSPPARIDGAAASGVGRRSVAPPRGSESAREPGGKLDSCRTPLYDSISASLCSERCPTAQEYCPTRIGTGVRQRRNAHDGAKRVTPEFEADAYWLRLNLQKAPLTGNPREDRGPDRSGAAPQAAGRRHSLNFSAKCAIRYRGGSQRHARYASNGLEGATTSPSVATNARTSSATTEALRCGWDGGAGRLRLASLRRAGRRFRLRRGP